MQITITQNTMGPHLNQLAAGMADMRGTMEAIGLGLQSLGAQAFSDPSLRPAAWPAKKDGSPATLRKSGTLWQSVRVTNASATSVSVGSDRLYAAIHQLGGKTPPHKILPKNGKALAWKGMRGGPYKSVNHPGSKIPARPYLPFDAAGNPTDEADEMIRDVIDAKMR